ncbi:MAG: PilZ domain-containing protein [Candidatus Omnitrophota bacterium]
MERRKYQRVAIELPLDYRSNRFLQYRKTNNISLGGVFLETENIEPKGIKVKLFLYFEGVAGALEAEGEVAWNRAQTNKNLEATYPAGMGIQFTKFSALVNREINKKIEI